MSAPTLMRSFTRGALGGFANLTPEKAEEKKNLERKLNEQALENWEKPEWHRQVAADLAETLTYSFTTGVNPFGQYIATKTVGEFDREVITERRGLKVYMTARGGHVDESKLRSEKWSVEKDTMGYHLVEGYDNYKANFAGIYGDIAALADARMKAEQWRRFIQLAQAAVPNTSAYYSSAAGVVEATLKAAVARVQEEIRPDGTGVAPVTIIGRGPTVNQILDYSGFSESIKDEVQRTGRLGAWRGANIVKLDHYADEDGVDFWPKGELWVLGGNAGRFINFGGVRVNQWTDNELEYSHNVGRAAIGAVLLHPEYTHRIIDSNL